MTNLRSNNIGESFTLNEKSLNHYQSPIEFNVNNPSFDNLMYEEDETIMTLDRLRDLSTKVLFLEVIFLFFYFLVIQFIIDK